nr:MAG TPA: hypothetical protein [Caudoviricetes sp.]
MLVSGVSKKASPTHTFENIKKNHEEIWRRKLWRT